MAAWITCKMKPLHYKIRSKFKLHENNFVAQKIPKIGDIRKYARNRIFLDTKINFLMYKIKLYAVTLIQSFIYNNLYWHIFAMRFDGQTEQLYGNKRYLLLLYMYRN